MQKQTKPPKILTLDTETYNGLIGKLKRIAIYDGEKVTYGYSYKDVEKVINFYNQKFEVHCYIHNMEFDLRKITEIFKRKDYINWSESFIISNKLAKLKCNNTYFHDSFKILPMSLKKASLDFNVKHGKLDLWKEVQKRYPNQYKDIVDFLDRCNVNDELFLEYLGYDVISLYEVLQELIKISGLKENEFIKILSTASLSRYIFKNGYKGHEFKKANNTKSDFEIACSFNYNKHLDIEEFLRQSYCGGRVEVFKPILSGRAFHYDINSLYPFVMKGNKYPVGKPAFYERPELAKNFFEEWLENHEGLGFINCKVFVPQQNVPPLPVKMGKLVFPCGEFCGTWTYEELEYAIKECDVKILEYYAVCHYSKTYEVFTDLIEHLYYLKEEGTKTGNLSLRTFAKLLMNCAYGYFGMRRDDKTTLYSFNKWKEHEKEIVFASEELGFIECPTTIRAEYIQVQIASYVTSRARLVLLKALKMVDKNGTIYYCDTDSIVTDYEFPSEMLDPVKLGFWDVEGEPVKGLFLKPKVYVEVFEDDKINKKFKGVGKDTQKELRFNDYEFLLEELKERKKEYVIVEKNKLMMRSIMYLEKNNKDLANYEYREKRFNLLNQDKRNINYSNNSTTPLFFKSEEEFLNFRFKKIEPVVDFNMY